MRARWDGEAVRKTGRGQHQTLEGDDSSRVSAATLFEETLRLAQSEQRAVGPAIGANFLDCLLTQLFYQLRVGAQIVEGVYSCDSAGVHRGNNEKENLHDDGPWFGILPLGRLTEPLHKILCLVLIEHGIKN